MNARHPARPRDRSAGSPGGIQPVISFLAAGAGLLLIAGCATYRPLALPTAPDLTRSPAVTVPAGQIALPGLKPHPIGPTRPLDETAVATLAVLNDPELKAQRRQAHVAEAQSLAAGLLPDPRLAGGLSRSTARQGYTVGLAEDLRALVTLPAVKAAARARTHQVNLQILWQEWQVAERARELFVRIATDRELESAAVELHLLQARHYRSEEAAFRHHDATAAGLADDLAALSAADAQRRRLRLDLNRARHALNRLLGLQPDVSLRLGTIPTTTVLAAADLQAAVRALPRRRVDLLALQAGYRSQEERVRAAVLGQFPSLSAGVEQARSAEEGIHTVGFTVDLTLPLFNRNRGRIAVARASRSLLRQTYQARLDAAASQADELWRAARLMARQQHALAARVAILQRTAREARRSFHRGDLAWGPYVRARSAALTARVELIRLRASLARADIALQTVLGLPIPSLPAS